MVTGTAAARAMGGGAADDGAAAASVAVATSPAAMAHQGVADRAPRAMSASRWRPAPSTKPWGRGTSATSIRRADAIAVSLGFTVRHLRNPDWTRDEIVLACALAEANGWRTVAQEDRRAIELSELLQSTAIHPLEGRNANFRNPAGVERKTGDLISRIPGSGRQPTNGSHLDGEVLHAFMSQPEEMLAEAQAIEAALRNWGDGSYALPDSDLDDTGVVEGSVLLKTHLQTQDPEHARNDQPAHRPYPCVCAAGSPRPPVASPFLKPCAVVERW